MAGSNSPFGSSASSILKSAASTANKIAEYNDAIAAFDYENSAHTDDAFTAYQRYLKGRIDGLKGGDLTSQQKALSLTKTLESAYHSNVSANIQRANIAIMAGGASKVDKYNLIADQYGKAVANGDYTLAQSLESQAYSLSQSIQYDQQQAASAAKTLAEASARAGARSENELATTLQDKLDQFNTDYLHAGQKTANSLLGDFVKQNADTFKALGIVLPKGVQPDYFSVVDGVNRAVYKAYSLAGDYVAPYAVDGGQSYYDKAAESLKSVSTIYGTMSAQDVINSIGKENNFSYNASPDFHTQGKGGPGGRQNPQIGYQYTAKNGIQPVIAQSPWVDIPNAVITQLNDLGLNIVSKHTSDGNTYAYTVTPSKNSPAWVQKVLPSNATSTVTLANSGAPGIQLEADAQNGTGKALYTITKDQNGKSAVFESSNLGDRLLTSDPGYDTTFAPRAADYTQDQVQPHPSFWSNLGTAFKTATSTFGSVFGGGYSSTTNPNSILKTSSQMQAKQQAEDAAARALLAKPTALPKLTLAPPASPTLIAPKPSAYPMAKLVQPTVSPQTPAPLSIQGGSGSGLNLQGGSISLQ